MQVQYKSSIERLRHWRDALRQRVVRCVLDRAPTLNHLSSDRVVFVRWDGKLGDTIVLSWVYRELQRARPDLRLTVLTHSALAQLHQEDFGVEDVIVCSKRPGFLEVLQISRRIKYARYVIHMTESFKPRDFLLIQCVKPAQVVSLDDSARVVNFKLGQRTQKSHFSAKLQPWFESIGIHSPNMNYTVPLDEKAQQMVSRAWPKAPVTGFCPSGAGGNRQMSDQTIRDLVTMMREVAGHRVMLLVGADQLDRMKRIVEDFEGSAVRVFCVDQCEQNIDSLALLFSQVHHCDFVVSVDTAIVHIATGLGKPQLALYNPDSTDHQNYPKWHPNSRKAITLFAERTNPQHIDGVDRQKFRQAYERLINDQEYI